MVEGEEEMITLLKEMAEMLLAESSKLQANQTSIVEKMSATLYQLTRSIEHPNGSSNEKSDTLNENVTILNGTHKDVSNVFDTKLERFIKILEKGSDVTIQAAQPFDSDKTIKFCYITESRYMAKFYELPELHKSEYLSSILGFECYILLPDFCQKLDRRPICWRPLIYEWSFSNDRHYPPTDGEIHSPYCERLV